MSDKIIHLTDDSFDNDVLKAEGLVLVDGDIETRKRCKIVAGQVVSFTGQEVTVQA